MPALRGLSLVAANYGLPQRNLGTVSVIGPTRMDYAVAIRSVRAAALQLSRFVEDVYTRVVMARDYYETLGVDRGADDAQIKKAFRRLARELHPDVNAHDPDAEEKFKEAAGAYEVLSDPERRRLYDAYGEEGLRGRGYAPDMDALRLGLGPVLGDLRPGRLRGRVRRRAAAAAAARAGPRAATSSRPRRSTSPTPRAASQVEVAYEAAALCATCHGNGAEPGTPIVTCRDLRRHRPAPARRAHRVRPARAHGDLRRLRRRRPRARDAVPRVRRRGARARAPARRGRHPAGHRRRPAHPADAPRPRGPERRARPATSTSSCGCARTSASCATART